MIGVHSFDRCINLTFFTEAGVKVAQITTPRQGIKPDILVRGTLLGISTNITTDVVVTNMEDTVPTDSIDYIYAELFYRGLTTQFLDSGKRAPVYADAATSDQKLCMYLHVLWAEPNTDPPDRQVTFHCEAVGVDSTIFGVWVPADKRGKADAGGNLPQETLDSVLNIIKDVYNTQLDATFANFSKFKPAKISTIEYPEGSDWATRKTSLPLGETLGDWLQSVVTSFRVPSKDTKNYYYPIDVLIDEDNKMVVIENPGSETGSISQPKSAPYLVLDNVLTAYRNGNIVHIRAMFDPRIRIGKWCKIKGSLIKGRAVGGKLMPVSDDYLPFQAQTRVDYEFGTVRVNSMRLQGIIPTEGGE